MTIVFFALAAYVALFAVFTVYTLPYMVTAVQAAAVALSAATKCAVPGLGTVKEYVGQPLKAFRNTENAGQLQVVRIERAGTPFPAGPDTKRERMDAIFVAGLKDAVSKLGEMLGRIARPSTATDLLTLEALESGT